MQRDISQIQHACNLFLLLKIINNYFIIIAILGVHFTVRLPPYFECTFLREDYCTACCSQCGQRPFVNTKQQF